MTDVAFIVRCQRCGVARKSYNDPTRGISVIECKRPCGNSHYEWTLLRTIPAKEEWPPASPAMSDIPLHVPPPQAALLARESENSLPSAHTNTARRGKVEFASKGKGSVVRPRFTSGGAQTVLRVVSSGDGAKGKPKNEASSSSVQLKVETGDCLV